MNEAADRRVADGSTAAWHGFGGVQDRLFGRFIALCGCATLILFAVGYATAPESVRPEILPAAGLVGVVSALAILFLRRGLSRRVFLAAGVALMALGVVVAASLPDSDRKSNELNA